LGQQCTDPCNFDDNLKALGLDIAGAVIPFATGLGKGYKAGKATVNWSKKSRKALGADGAKSWHLVEKYGDETISIVHQVENVDGAIIHQHQTHVGRYGGERRFPNEWIQYPDIGSP
jgi:hypothetical protein